MSASLYTYAQRNRLIPYAQSPADLDPTDLSDQPGIAFDSQRSRDETPIDLSDTTPQPGAVQPDLAPAQPQVDQNALTTFAQANKPQQAAQPDGLDFATMPGMFAQQPAQGPRPQVPTPPQLEGPNPWALGGAALLDLALNRGRHTGELIGAIAQGNGAVDNQNYHNQLEAARTQAQIDHLYAQKTGDPMANYLRVKNLELSGKRLENAVGREKRLEQILADKNNPDRLSQARQYFVDGGIPDEEIPRDSAQFEKLLPALTRRLQNTGPRAQESADAAALKAGAVAKATAPTKVAVAGQSAAAAAGARLPYQEALQDYGIGTQAAKSQNTQAARIKANAGATDQGEQEAQDVIALHPWLGFAGDAGKRQYLREGANRFTQKPRNEDIQLADQMINASAEMSTLIDEYRSALKSADPAEMSRVSAKYNQYRNEHAGIIRRISKESNAAGVGEHIREDLPSKLGVMAPEEMKGISEFLHEQSNARMALHGMFVREYNPSQISAHFKKLRANNPAPEPAAPKSVTATANGFVDDNGDEWK